MALIPNPVSRLLYLMDGVGADLAPGITSGNDDMLNKDFITGVSLGKAGNWQGMNRKDIADLRSMIAEGANSDDSALRKVVSDFQNGANAKIAHLDQVQHFGLFGRGDQQDADYMASMQDLKAFILQFTGQTYPTAKGMAVNRAAALQAAADAAKAAAAQASLPPVPGQVPLMYGQPQPPGYPTGFGPPMPPQPQYDQYGNPIMPGAYAQQPYGGPPTSYGGQYQYQPPVQQYQYQNTGGYYTDPSQDPLYNGQTYASPYGQQDPFAPYAVSGETVESRPSAVGRDYEIVGDDDFLNQPQDFNMRVEISDDPSDSVAHPIAVAHPAIQAAALTKAAGKDPTANYLIMGLTRIEKEPAYAMEIAKGDMDAAAILQAKSSGILNIMRGHMQQVTAATLDDGGGVGADPTGVDLGALLTMLGGPLAGAVTLLQKAFAGDTAAISKAKAIKKAADAGDPDAKDGVATMRVADGIISKTKSKTVLPTKSDGSVDLYQAGVQ